VRLQAGEAPQVTLPEETGEITAASREVQSATWDAPDLVWIAGILPATDVLRGLGLSMLATVVPTMLYVGTLYWADRYEKEPKRLLASAFLWGAIPAILVALAVRVFFRLPPELLGPKAIEALQTGLVAPLMEEALKGAVVLWIAWRYRMEFDDVLDGIVYGAMAGFGFAMTGNALSYLGAFLLRGFSGLSNTIFVQGVLYGLNHAMYSAIFGAGLGYARLARKRWQRWAVPLAAFVLSVVVHAVHNLVLQNSMGLNPFTVLITWGGVLVIVVVMVLALRRQKRSLIEELPGEIPEQLYQSMISGDLRRKAYWSALRRGGLRGWRTMRRTNQLCAELAQKKMQYRLRPEDAAVGEEMARLRNELGAMVAKWRRLADH
jgi:RsiW-degrading membrane proteinase PrsW (M82 family)